eukprot:1298373-Rhodomonas_salina.1
MSPDGEQVAAPLFFNCLPQLLEAVAGGGPTSGRAAVWVQASPDLRSGCGLAAGGLGAQARPPVWPALWLLVGSGWLGLALVGS